MAITISGANNVDKILATDGVLDSISGFNVVGVMTAGTFDVTGKTTTGHLNIGSNIQLGNAGIITATTLIGNVTGNVNATSNLLLQIGGSEKFRVASSGQLGIGGANYGSSGQVLTSGGSGSAATWSTIASDKITEGNTEAEVVDTGSDGHFKVTTEGGERVRVGPAGQIGIAGANYGTSGQVLTSGGSGSTISWTTITGTTINNNAANKVIMGSNTANTLEAVAKSTLFGNLSHGQNFLDDQNLVFGDASDMILIHTSSGAKSRLRNTNDSGSLDIESTLTRFLNKDGSTEKLRIDSSGNINIGAKDYNTHSASIDSLQIGYALNLYEDSYSSGNDNYIVLANNLYYDSGNKYMRNDEASRIMMQGGAFYFQNAAAGTAGNAITLVDRLRITSSGRYGFNQNSPQYAMHLSPEDGQTRMDLHMTNSTTGHNNTDGVQFGYQNSAGAYIWNYENTDIYFGTSNNTRMKIKNDGTVQVNEHLTSRNGIVQINQVTSTTRYSGSVASVDLITGSTFTPKTNSPRFLIMIFCPVNTSDDSDAGNGNRNDYFYGRIEYRKNGGSWLECNDQGSTAQQGGYAAHIELSPNRTGNQSSDYWSGNRYRMEHKQATILVTNVGDCGDGGTVQFKLRSYSYTGSFLSIGQPHGSGTDDNYGVQPWGFTVFELAPDSNSYTSY